ncbi:hypothetical protein [Mesorhizobium sp. KR9-304]|uniref:hypothetical protein n=1 Tax=Mesorhizobium sp. KR9-304 TaxID=3156614 RepID=UPI0032B4D4B7
MGVVYIFLNSLLEGALYGLAPLVLTMVFVFVFSYLFLKNKFDAFTISSFAGFGCFLGIFIGGSREPIAGVILPSIITLIGGFVAYFFTKEKEVFDRRIIPGTILGLVTAAAFGSSFAGELRATQAQFEYLRDIEKSQRESEIRLSEDFQQNVVNAINRYAICVKNFPTTICEKYIVAKTP